MNHTRLFTQDEISILKSNPYTLFVSKMIYMFDELRDLIIGLLVS